MGCGSSRLLSSFVRWTVHQSEEECEGRTRLLPNVRSKLGRKVVSGHHNRPMGEHNSKAQTTISHQSMMMLAFSTRSRRSENPNTTSTPHDGISKMAEPFAACCGSPNRSVPRSGPRSGPRSTTRELPYASTLCHFSRSTNFAPTPANVWRGRG
jgi:hypothetical protein